MLDNKRFLQGLKYLNAYYSNFNFDINDDFKISVWYNTFKHIDGDSYSALVKAYCEQSIYAPQSPTHLLEFARTLTIGQHMNSDNAWDYALSILRAYNYDFRHFYNKCEYGIISDTIKQIQGDFVGLLTEHLPFVKKHFVEVYHTKIKQHVDTQVKEGLLWTTQVSLLKEK